MRTFRIISFIFSIVVASSGAFTPTSNSRTSFSLQNTPTSTKPSKAEAPIHKNHNAAFAAFATAMAPVVVQAAEIEDGTAVGFGAGIVACVVSLAVGFSIGYGTLV